MAYSVDLQKTVREALAAVDILGGIDPSELRIELTGGAYIEEAVHLLINAPTWLAAQADEIERLRTALGIAETCLADNARDWPQANELILTIPFHPFTLAEKDTAEALAVVRAALKPSPAEVSHG